MAEPIPCGVCGIPHPREKCHIIVLTETERSALLANGQEPKDEYIYCRPCWKTLSNPVSGPAMIKGLVQMRLRLAGVEDSERLATQLHARLVAKIIKPRA